MGRANLQIVSNFFYGHNHAYTRAKCGFKNF